ncbi:MAG: YkoF family thiamine/hydroxymethylpyrimidine-binding protein [Dehalococcoidia bacterium]
MVTCQFSLYPLRESNLSLVLDGAMEEVRSAGLQPQVGLMSTYVEGDHDIVFEALRRAFRRAAGESEVVLVATVSNACQRQGG